MPTRVKQRVVIELFAAGNAIPTVIRRRLKTAYGDDAVDVVYCANRDG